ncbi:MAG: glycosyltransferase family 4 protein [Prevotella sp.]|jgi:glycosyltransferase involved in cell wall biosynthesis|nr:glycosyltransferase family 4 protein [Prevotella sp.]
MNVTYITNFPSIDIKHWSGTVHFMATNLAKYTNVDYITNLREDWSFFLKVKNKLYGSNKIYRADRSPQFGMNYARQIQAQLNPATDILFSHSSTLMSYLKTSKHKVFYTDATFASMINYYDYFTNLSPRYIKEGNRMEQLSLDTSRLAIYSSQWAADSAIRDYNADPDKVKIVPFGANISTRQLSLDEIKDVLSKRNQRVCKILFLGVDWFRKGGDITIEAVKYLNEELRLPTELHIVGIDHLPVDNLPPYIINHGRISKATPEGMKKVEDLILQSHFLFIPSRADCTPIVFSEAMSYGVPCISAGTGGIPSIVNDTNGIILSPDAAPKDYAEQIYKTFENKIYYNELALSAYNDFETRLNWDTAMKTIVGYLKEI